MTLARIDGAPPGIKGVSLFAVPNAPPTEDGPLVDNDVHGRGPDPQDRLARPPEPARSAFGERGDCHGWLVGRAAPRHLATCSR